MIISTAGLTNRNNLTFMTFFSLQLLIMVDFYRSINFFVGVITKNIVNSSFNQFCVHFVVKYPFFALDPFLDDIFKGWRGNAPQRILWILVFKSLFTFDFHSFWIFFPFGLTAENPLNSVFNCFSCREGRSF